MSRAPRKSYDAEESSSFKWVIVFALLSLLAHIIIIAVILLITIYMPPPPVHVPPPDNTVNLTLEQAPPQPMPKQGQKPLFISTNPDASAKPNQDTPVESNHDNRLKSENKTARKPDAPLPDVTGKKDHSLDLQTTPLSSSQKPQQANPTPPTPKQEDPKPPTPQQPKQQPQAQKPQPQPAKPTQKPPEQTPPKPSPPQPSKNTVDPITGLPVLPPIDAPTLAPQTQPTQTPQTQRPAAAAPPPSFQVDKSDVAGSTAAQGANSAATRATPLGRYKALVYRAVGSRWYAKVGQSQSLLPVGRVHVQFTIYADGTVETKTLDSGNSNMQMLLSISINSIREAAIFPKFDDYPGMREDLIKEQGGDGSSYTDDFWFSVY